MLRDGSFKRIILCTKRVDLRRGIDGLSAYIRLNFGLEPLEKGTLFLFCGKRTDRIKALIFEGTGTCLIYYRLAPGNRFQWPRTIDEAKEISPEQYRRLMDGFMIDGTIKEVYQKLPTDGQNK